MKNIFLKLCRWALGILGLAAVDSCGGLLGKEEYGCPYSDYEIKGKVVDKNTGKPLPQIEVEAFTSHKGPDGQIVLDPIYIHKDTTKLDGIFNISGQGMVFDEKIVLKCRDIDTSDGYHGETQVSVKVTDKDTGNAGTWYHGKFVYDASEIQMEEKPAE